MPVADIVVDLGFGDAGKGATVDRLARLRNPDWIVRYSGGAQCAHNVVTPEGQHHCFHQFGSGLLARPDVKTYLTKEVCFDPFMAVQEKAALAKLGIDAKLVIHPEALIVTPWHVAMNRLRETLRGFGRHGSCGMGIGEARGDEVLHGRALRAKTLGRRTLRDALAEVQQRKSLEARALVAGETLPLHKLDPMIQLLISEESVDRVYEQYTQALKFFCLASPRVLEDAEYLIFEGAQGVLLDEWVGFYPHTTWTDTTSGNAEDLLDEMGVAERSLIGVVRAFQTRHGAGPFPSEGPEIRTEMLKGEHNAYDTWQEGFRTGWFDMLLAQYAIEANGTKPDELVITCLDRLGDGPVKAVMAYNKPVDLAPPPVTLTMQQMMARQEAVTAALADMTTTTVEYPSTDRLVQAIRENLGIEQGWETYSPRYQGT